MDTKREDDEPIVIYESSNRAGTTFALSPHTEMALERKLGDTFKPAPRIFIAHATKDDTERLHVRLWRQILMLLTGLPEDRLAELGKVEFRDAVTEKLIARPRRAPSPARETPPAIGRGTQQRKRPSPQPRRASTRS